jgi:hypothetical protein
LNIPLDILKTVITRFPAVVPHLSHNTRILAGIKASMDSINKKYHDAITGSLVDYFEGGGSVTAPRSRFQRAMVEAFGAAFDAGYIDGGGELPFDGEALQWFNARVDEEAGHIDSVFQDAKDLRKDKEFDYFTWAIARADMYTSALAAIYNAAVMFADARLMLTWNLGNTEKHCKTCSKLDGQRHKAAWYLSRNYIPRKPGAAMDCSGYNCDCSLTNDKGEEVTI